MYIITEEIQAHVHPGPIVPDVLTRQHEHRSGLIWSGDHKTCFTDLQCMRFGRNLFQCYSTAPRSQLPTHTLVTYRDQLDFMTSDQRISDACDTHLDLHRIQLRGNNHTYWETQHASHVEAWHQWRLRVRNDPALAVGKAWSWSRRWTPSYPSFSWQTQTCRPRTRRDRESHFIYTASAYIANISSDDEEWMDDTDDVQRLGFGHRVGKKTTRNTTNMTEHITAVTQMVSNEPSMLYTTVNNDDNDVDESNEDDVVSSQSESDDDNDSEEGELQTP
ncbi:hypothetical protein M9H77_26606 [Catharanthus roseus]|uniref:Uncharacterized protein n=1 Tax=Catharanthus roseus TaxID=4058 RepID=A0ACC0ACU5_CATRO|nr:hypothetical protein M9H77_26606 [Catharanthus roseus]